MSKKLLLAPAFKELKIDTKTSKHAVICHLCSLPSNNTGQILVANWSSTRLQPTHLDDLDGLFDLLQFLGSLLDQMFYLRPLLTQITLQGENEDCGSLKSISTALHFYFEKCMKVLAAVSEAFICCF